MGPGHPHIWKSDIPVKLFFFFHPSDEYGDTSVSFIHSAHQANV